ncbi:uncharacterized protein I206_105784 [Kwoniella pini CBS 10737]|uniref:Uncharacterized protein n=1 Tax=Kwoniella pini CBS 10737 TaxID=1296096 RepID=A0AAJ8LAN4_9TREE
MEQNIDNAKQYLNSEEGQGYKEQLFDNDKPTGDSQIDEPTYDAQGNKGAPGQYGKEGQFGAVTGKGFGGGFQEKKSDYEGMEHGDSTATGGYGRNAQGSSFSRQNQMGVDNDNQSNPGGVYENDDNDHKDGLKTGYSTPGYRKEGEDEDENSRKLYVYGKQSDDSGSNGNDYNEADI